jgi:asparagine synthase (glutamine-hydrolysing)
MNGFIGRDERLLAEMNAAIAHRGPDFAGTYVDDDVSLGHRLLAIREAAEASRQPFTKPGSPWVLLFNGQLYNTRELKRELGPEHAQTDLDTALLFAMIERHGWGFIERVHGMFAIALYHRDSRRVRLYRDPSGQKVLYYYLKDGRFAWSSELKALLTDPRVDRTVDEEALALAARFGYVPGVKTLHRFIRKVHLSEEVTFDLASKAISSRFYESRADGYFPEDDEAAFRLLIEEHLQSKRPVAINLSGGLDSSLLVHEMSRLGHEVHTYTDFFVGEDEAFNADALLARRLSKDYGTRHVEIPIRPEDVLENLVPGWLAVEEPNYNIGIPIYLATAKREGARGDGWRVILSGDGGDEIFGGYDYYRLNRRIDRMQRLLTPPLYDFLKNLRDRLDYRYEVPIERWMFFRTFHRRFVPRGRDGDKAYMRSVTDPLLRLYALKDDSLSMTMMMDRLLWMGAENLIRSDKLTMSQSLELRAPLAYHPFRLHMDRRIAAADRLDDRTNKIFLRRHYKGKLPDYIVDRLDKSGWHPPMKRWYDQRFKDLFLDIVTSVEGNDGPVRWKEVKRWIEGCDGWPGKIAHLYLSLAVLSRQWKLGI